MVAKQIWSNKIATFNTYLCSWHHLLQIHCCRYTQSYQFCQCSWHTYGSCVSQIHTHWCLLKESNGKRCDTENNSKTYYIVCLQQRYVWTSSAEYNIIKCLFNYDSITGLTCTVDPISTKTSIADALKATNGVITGGIFMAVINFSCTVINICNEQVVQLCYQHPTKEQTPSPNCSHRQATILWCLWAVWLLHTTTSPYIQWLLMPVLSPQKFSSPLNTWSLVIAAQMLSKVNVCPADVLE